MTTSSPRPAPLRELRTGTWTRLGDPTVLGDPVTEHTLAGLVDQTQAAAQAQGYSRGWAEGRTAAQAHAEQLRAEVEQHAQAAERRRADEHLAGVAALHAAVARLDRGTAEVCARVEDQALTLAVELAETFLGRELRFATQPGLDAVRRALALAPGEPVVTVRVSPGDRSPEVTAEVGQRCGAARVVADPVLARGDAVVETTVGVVDARVSAAVSRVRELLR